jgi:hypothetical protein
MTFDEVDINLTEIVFDIGLNDPEEVITGQITVDLFLNNERIRTQNITDYESLFRVTFRQLVQNTTYRIDVFATIDRDSVKIGTYTFTTLSSEVVSIETPQDFLDMRNNRSGNYVLAKDLDFTDVTFTTPFTSSFSGTFDGQGFTISNINITTISTYTGVFGYISTGKVFDLTLDNITIGTVEEPLTMATSSRVGILAGYVASASSELTNITITNSHIHYTTASTVHAYVGGAVGEQRGKMEDVTLDNVTVSVVGQAHGRIKLGGVVGYLYEDAQLKRISSNADVIFNLDAQNTRDRDFSIIIGGVIGDNASKTVLRAVDSIYSTGDITITNLDFNTLESTVKGTYGVFVGGLAGVSYSNIYQGFYGGNISVTHEKNAFESVVSKSMVVGGLIGVYASNQPLDYLIRYSDNNTIDIIIADDVNMRYSQTVGQNVRSSVLNVGVYGDLHITLNGNDVTGNNEVPVITDADTFFITDWIKTEFPN